jgi:hypothetical protein
MNASLLSSGFGWFVAVLAAVLIAVLWRALPRRSAIIGALGLLAWLVYAGAIGASGVMRDASLRPPGIAYLALPMIAFIAWGIARGPVARQLASAVPLWLLLGLQVFRIGVEATLQALFEVGQVPRLMTLEGGNVEIVVALAAPAAAWLSTRGAVELRLAWAWNAIGLASLLNVVMRGVLTSPGPLQLIHAEVPNLAIGQFPFSYIPGFMVPLALILHLLAFRGLGGSTNASGDGAAMKEPIR